MSNIENLKASINCKAYLVKDKFSDKGYWLIGKHQDCEGESFAQAVCNYFEQQYEQLVLEEQIGAIKNVCDKYDGLGLVT